MLRSWFFTATDTGIGKTSVTAASVIALRGRGIDVGVMKPYAAGIPQSAGFKSEDASILANAAGVHDEENLINPYFFNAEASPYTAAERLGIKIDPELVLSRFETLQASHDVLLVEGIGGLLTPILKDYSVADLIKELGTDVILVISSRLGTVNHTLLTCDACSRCGIGIRGIVINEAAAGYDAAELQKDITNLTGIEVLCTVPYLSPYDLQRMSQVVAQSKLMGLLTS